MEIEQDMVVSPNPRKPKVVVIMGATGAGKSRLAIDLASSFPVEIINADSMQVYRGLDVLTNKVPVEDQRGVQHHLLGCISADTDFTSKHFRDLAIPIIDDILSRNHLPVIVGGTNYYIQALLGSFLLDEPMEDMEEDCQAPIIFLGTLKHFELNKDCDDSSAGFDLLKKLDPTAANRVHPNDHRKVHHYLRLYASSGVPPSKLLQGKASEKWCQADNFRYDCCLIWVDASLPVLDRYVEQRVDSMIEAGLLKEVYDIYHPNSNYTSGLLQAIGVREFDDFLRLFLSNGPQDENGSHFCSTSKHQRMLETDIRGLLNSEDEMLKIPLREAIDKLKANTRRLVRRQKRRLNRFRTFFGWDLHYVDATEAFLCPSGNSWTKEVVETCVDIINCFLCENMKSGTATGTDIQKPAPRDLWTQYVCEACGNRVLRGAHEWEQHKQGRGHRKRVYQIRKKSQNLPLIDNCAK